MFLTLFAAAIKAAAPAGVPDAFRFFATIGLVLIYLVQRDVGVQEP